MSTLREIDMIFLGWAFKNCSKTIAGGVRKIFLTTGLYSDVT